MVPGAVLGADDFTAALAPPGFFVAAVAAAGTTTSVSAIQSANRAWVILPPAAGNGT